VQANLDPTVAGFVGAFRPEAVLDEPWQPMGLSFDQAGRLLVTDLREGKHRVLVFRPGVDQLHASLGEGESRVGGLQFPYAAVVDPQGRTYVSDSNNAVVEVFGAEGQLLSVLSAADPKAGIGLPRGMAIDSLDRLHVVDGATHSVSVFETGDRLRFLYSFGEIGTAGPELRYPGGIALDQRGRVYVADRGNNAVKVWSY
jgi:DNA-binding beta-propeller fold protein YncE